MADFVAVIRRAVDGLAKNTPEMRAKVYDKARAAVRRQLENMKPTPSEDLILRQMGKLEAAIESVEAEHAEALPADAPAVAPVVAAPDVGYEQEPVAEQPPAPEAVAEPAAPVASDAEWQHHEAAPAQSEAVEDYPGDHRERADEPHQGDHGYAEPAHEAVVEAYPEDTAPAQEPDYPPAAGHGAEAFEPVGETWPRDPDAPSEGEHHQAYSEHPGEAEEPRHVEADVHPATWPEQDAAYLPHEQHPADVVAPEPVSATSPVEEETGWHPEEVQPPAPAAGDEWTWPPEEPRREAAAAWDRPETFETTSAPAEGSHDHQPSIEPVEAHFGEETHVSADSVRMPSIAEFPEVGETGHVDPARPEDEGAYAAYATDPAPRQNGGDPWTDLEELIGYNKDALPASTAAAIGAGSGEEMVPPPPRTYRVAPKKRNYTAPILAVIAFLIVAAGAYALWINRDEIIGDAGVPSTSDTATGQAAGDAAPAAGAAGTADATAPAQATAPQADATAGASEDGVSADAKFTQRLLADGTEVDDGPAAGGPTGEGQSVAQLNAPPAAPAQAGAAPEAAPTEPAATPADAAALAGEKMFLYEERLGQTAPTAIEGAVSWSLQQEAGQDGRQEPVVQGRINVPGRGLTALMTFKRNTDPSLPASHLVEIVFAVPAGFEGGAIDSVQRIAMKQTEQDRGDSLIAVPAKITDDFHMIALNDFPDARATNIELMRSRNWIDIPLSYRNGRRALLTLQKGPAGTEAFNEAIREWGALNGGTNGTTPPPPTGQ